MYLFRDLYNTAFGRSLFRCWGTALTIHPTEQRVMARPGTQEATAEQLADGSLLPPLHRGDSGGRSGPGVPGAAWMVESIPKGG